MGRDRFADPQGEHRRHHQQRDGHRRPTERNRGTGGLATDSAGNLYIGDTQSYLVRKVDTSGVMTSIAGNGTAGISGNNGNGSQATSVPICSPSGVVADRAGNVYFGSSICGTVRKVDTSGVLSTYAGNGSPSFI